MSSLTQLELFKVTMEHKCGKETGFLFYAEITADLKTRVRNELGIPSGVIDKDWFGMFRPILIKPFKPDMAEIPREDLMEYYSDIDMPPNAEISSFGVLLLPGSMYHFRRYISPLRNISSLDEIMKYPFPSHKGCTQADLRETVDTAHAGGRVASCLIGHMYEEAWQIRGYENFLADMALDPENCEYILDRIIEYDIETAVAAAKAGADLINTGDDVANQRDMMFSADMWRRFIKPRWARLYSEVKKANPGTKIRYHSDGNIISIIPELIEIGVDILNPVQPECLDLSEISRRFGKDLVFDGGIGTQSVMPFGMPDDVRKAVRELKQTLGRDGALIISPTHMLEPEVPIANICAFAEACRETIDATKLI